ncbi:MAG TPA: Na+/H+ antiporter subunit D [Microbacteriaceae bacterium]|nr:Na+/H+ antiporter subunit D [Microbacteriaceae bacterium]
MNLLVPLVVLIPLLAAAVALVAARRPLVQRLITAVALTAVLLLGIALVIIVDAVGALTMEVGGWAAPFGIVLVVDRLAALMVAVSALVLLGVFVFSVGQGLVDGDDETPVTIFYPTYLILGVGVFTAFIAGDLFNLYVGFEILLVASYVLITVGGTEPRVRAGTTYIVVSLVSSLMFLGSIAMIYASLGTVNLAHIALRIGEIPPDIQLILHVMLLIAFGVKAAIFPLSFWLPDSYPTAPAPVTAVFAGLLTKVGIYAIMRTETLIFPGPELNPVLMIAALASLVLGILGAVAQADIKRMLSFILISHIGYLLLGISLGSTIGTAATTYYIVHHIVVQTTLFLAVGLIERVGGSTSILRLGGLVKVAPAVAVLFFLGVLNLGGIPPFSGFLGKYALFVATAQQGGWLGYTLIAAGALVSLLTLYVLMRAWTLAFLRPAEQVEGYESNLIGRIATAPGSTRVKAARQVPALMTGATVGMVIASIGLTVLAGPLFAISDRAGEGLETPERYIELVFPNGSPAIDGTGVVP